MARSSRKSVMSSAAAAVKRVMSPRGSDGDAGTKADAARSTAKRTAKKTASKAAPAKKAASKKAAAAKKAVAKSAASSKKAVPAEKTASKSAASKTTPAKKTASKAMAKKQTTGAPTAAPAKKATKAAAKKATKAPAKKTTKAPATKAARKAAPARLAVRPEESEWTHDELQEVVTELTEDAARLRAEITEHEHEISVLIRDSGDGAGHDQADVGASSFERDHELTVFNNTRDMLVQTEHALERIADNSYGVCESCGNPIGKMRLMAFPRATLCLSCKQREERR